MYSGFESCFSGKLSPGYTAPSMATDEVNRSWVRRCSHSALFRDQGTDDKKERLTPFPHQFFIRNAHYANVFLSKSFWLFLRDMMSFYTTAAAVNKCNLAIEVVAILEKSLQLKSGRPALSFFAQGRIDLLKRGYTIPESFAEMPSTTIGSARPKSAGLT